MNVEDEAIFQSIALDLFFYLHYGLSFESHSHLQRCLHNKYTTDLIFNAYCMQ